MTNKTYVPSAELMFATVSAERLDHLFMQLVQIIGQTSPLMQPHLQKLLDARANSVQELMALRSERIFAGEGDATRWAVNNGAKFKPVLPAETKYEENFVEWLTTRALELNADGVLSFHSDFKRLGTTADLEAALGREEGRMAATGLYEAQNGIVVLASIYTHAEREHVFTATWNPERQSMQVEHQILLITEKSWIADFTLGYLDRDALEFQLLRASPAFGNAVKAGTELKVLANLGQEIADWAHPASTEDRLPQLQEALDAGGAKELKLVPQPNGENGLTIGFHYPAGRYELTPLAWRAAQLQKITAIFEALRDSKVAPVVEDIAHLEHAMQIGTPDVAEEV